MPEHNSSHDAGTSESLANAFIWEYGASHDATCSPIVKPKFSQADKLCWILGKTWN